MNVLIKLPGAEGGAETVEEIHEVATGDELGAAVAAVDEDEVAEAVAVEEAVEKVAAAEEGVGAEGLVPVVVGWDDQVVTPLRHQVVAPSCYANQTRLRSSNNNNNTRSNLSSNFPIPNTKEGKERCGLFPTLGSPCPCFTVLFSPCFAIPFSQTSLSLRLGLGVWRWLSSTTRQEKADEDAWNDLARKPLLMQYWE